MPPRFTSAALSPRRLYEQRVARAWRCFAFMITAVTAGLITLLMLPCLRQLRGGELSLFLGIPYTDMPETPAAAPPGRSLRLVALLPVHAPIPPAPLPETELPPVDIPETEIAAAEELPSEVFSMAEELPEPIEHPAAAPRPAPARPAEHRPQGTPPAARAETGERQRTAPAYRYAPRPPYPDALRRRGLSGTVGVRISVSAEGKPTAVDITAPSGHAELDDTTRQWILRRWSFRPGTENGEPVPSVVRTSVNFTLNL